MLCPRRRKARIIISSILCLIGGRLEIFRCVWARPTTSSNQTVSVKQAYINYEPPIARRFLRTTSDYGTNGSIETRS